MLSAFRRGVCAAQYFVFYLMVFVFSLVIAVRHVGKFWLSVLGAYEWQVSVFKRSLTRFERARRLPLNRDREP